ncbi:MAG: glucosaminidase domain-containing protein [Miltoncostaeaceae bacterium]
MNAPRLLLPLIALVAMLVASPIGDADGLGASSPTPVLGSAVLSADQMAAWYGSTGIVPRSPTPVATLAATFLDEGSAQGVRGDLAFAQSMLETGYLRYGGQVRPSDHNFSGLGACDSCPRGLAFPDAMTGVRAQIQHLWAYASPTARADATARPNVDIRFDFVNPKGRAPSWERMGAGNWATDPEYARKVLGIYASMLRHAGLPEDAARTPLSSAAPPAIARVVRASPNGAVHLASWAPHRTGLAGAPATLGPARSTTSRPGGCLIRWPALGVVAATRGACAGDAGTPRLLYLTQGWRTARGLAVGDSVQRLRALYPAARRAGARHHLVVTRSSGRRAGTPRLSAEVRGGRVRALIASARSAVGS